MSKYQNDKLFSNPVTLCSAKLKLFLSIFSRFCELKSRMYYILSVLKCY